MLDPLLMPLLFGALIGLALGMLGGGGSILTVPILVYILHQDAHVAVATSLVIVGANAVTGAWLHWRAGHVQIRESLLFAAYGSVAAYGGARLSQLLSDTTLMILFALLMLLVASLMLRGGSRVREGASEQPRKWWQTLLGGLAVGFLTGFLGVGGGFLIVPALVLLLRMDMADAVGSSLVVIALNSGAGLLGHLSDASLPWSLIGLFVVGGLAGLRLGAHATKLLSAARLRQSFAWFVVALAIVLLVVNVPSAMGTAF